MMCLSGFRTAERAPLRRTPPPVITSAPLGSHDTGPERARRTPPPGGSGAEGASYAAGETDKELAELVI